MKDIHILGGFGIIMLILIILSLALLIRTNNVNDKLSYQISILSKQLNYQNETMHKSFENVYEKISRTNGRINSINETVGRLSKNISDFESEFDLFRSEFNEFKQKYINLSVAYNEKSEQYTNLKNDLISLDDKIKEKMVWFESNNQMNTTEIDKTRTLLNNIDDKCVKSTYINVPCLVAILENNNYKYIPDKSDQIESLDQFIEQKGGDCEDWVMFVKAILNRYPDKDLKLAVDSPGSRFDLYKQNNVIWYFNDLKPKYIHKNGEHYVGVCYTKPKQGHCIIGLTKSDLLEPGDILFEPQNGKYLGQVVKNKLNQSDKLLYFDDYEHNMNYPIVVVIKSKDIDVWDDENEKWINYKQLDDRIENILNLSD